MKLDIVHTDKRGVIASLTDDLIKHEVAIFTTKAGKARGGCVHDINNEELVVIGGHIELYLVRKDGVKVRFVLIEGMEFKIKARTPHYYVAVKDSVVMEFGTTIEEKQNKHPRTRKIVEAINA
jgi:hypothetical protein